MSNTANISIILPEPSGYGAVELKQYIQRYTYRGFYTTVGIMLLLLLLYFVVSKVGEAKDHVLLAPPVQIDLQNLAADDASANDIAPPPPEQMVNTGPAARAGTPVPVPDAQISADMQEFASVDVMSRASAEGGTGVDLGGFSDKINFDDQKKVVIENKETEPAPDDFIPVEQEPGVDLGKLQKNIVYPDLARRAGIEGRVIVRVLVGADGKARKTLIESSDNEMLNESAVKAIKDYGLFTPAKQNGQPIMCWVSIPINFRLR
ncbi:MAG: TonB family protein [Candidatus Gastranaerophilaceae bacterium]|jgi:protein TonB